MSRHPEFAAYKQRTGTLFPAFGPGVSNVAMALVSVLAAFLVFAEFVPTVPYPTADGSGNSRTRETHSLQLGQSGDGNFGIAKDLRIGRVLTR
jgi:hypothetical protein